MSPSVPPQCVFAVARFFSGFAALPIANVSRIFKGVAARLKTVNVFLLDGSL